MRNALESTQDSGWLLSHEGYNVLTESAVESRHALGNGFLGMRAARSVSRGPTWVAWLGYSRWASWPRCYVAGLFDVPNVEPPVPALVPVADWSRVRILLDGKPLLAREGEVRLGARPFVNWQAADVATPGTNRAGLQLRPSGYKFEQRGLTDSIAADNSNRLACRDGKVEALDDGGRSPAARQADDFKHLEPHRQIATVRTCRDTPHAPRATPSLRLAAPP